MTNVKYLDLRSQPENEYDDAKVNTEGGASSKTTIVQKWTMLQFWEKHLFNDYSRSVDERDTIKLWNDLTEILNKCVGPKRTTKSWSLIWSDLKLRILNKCRKGIRMNIFEERMTMFLNKCGEPTLINCPNKNLDQTESETQDVADTEMDNVERLDSNKVLEQTVHELGSEAHQEIKTCFEVFKAKCEETSNNLPIQCTEKTLDLQMDIFPEDVTSVSVRKNSEDIDNGCDDVWAYKDKKFIFRKSIVCSKKGKSAEKVLSSKTCEPRITVEQKCKLLKFWQKNIKFYKKFRSLNLNHRNFLWNELARVVNKCEGPWKTSKEWAKVWADARERLKVKLIKKLPMSNLDQKYISFFFKYDEQFDEVTITEENNVVLKKEDEPGPQTRLDDQNEDYQLEHSAELHENKCTDTPLKNILTSYIEGHFEIQKEALELHQHHLAVQKQMLADRQELVCSLNKGVQVMLTMLQNADPEAIPSNKNSQRSTESVISIAKCKTKNLKTVVIKRNNFMPNQPPSASLPRSLQVNEFESFAQNVQLQLKELPPNNALKTKILIENVLKERSTEALKAMEDKYILNVINDH